MKAKWYEKNGPEGDVVVSTRVRFARNLRDYPFPGRMKPEQEREVIDKVAAALAASSIGGGFRLVEMSAADEVARRAMVERHVISPELAAGKNAGAVLLNEDESVAVMINEEDHLRIQVMGAGLCLDECLKRAAEVDGIFDRALKYAFNEKLGYLTKCPTNLGTGMRASVMLHLPALTESGAIRNLASNAAKLGFAVRGMYGEGSAAKGALYQISNQTTLGFTEEGTVERLEDALGQIISQERGMRQNLFDRAQQQLEDRIWRSAGALRYARSMSTDEALDLIGDLRMGVSLGMLEMDTAELNRLLWEIQPANIIESSGGKDMTPEERDRARAAHLREILKI